MHDSVSILYIINGVLKYVNC